MTIPEPQPDIKAQTDLEQVTLDQRQPEPIKDQIVLKIHLNHVIITFFLLEKQILCQNLAQ